jgi:hypothetical protein
MVCRFFAQHIHSIVVAEEANPHLISVIMQGLRILSDEELGKEFVVPTSA